MSPVDMKFTYTHTELTGSESNKSQLTQTDPRDALRHVQLTIALYTQVHAESDQQATVVAPLLTTFSDH